MAEKLYLAVMLLAAAFVLGACTSDYDAVEADFNLEGDVPLVDELVPEEEEAK
ncbi:MAG: hypothetical protein ACLFTR_00260 [Candidatus Woesearchaeota archaeon]